MAFAERCMSKRDVGVLLEDEESDAPLRRARERDRERAPVQDAILDGEIVVMGEGGPKFYALMMNREPASYVAFDLLWLDGRDLRGCPLWRRKVRSRSW